MISHDSSEDYHSDEAHPNSRNQHKNPQPQIPLFFLLSPQTLLIVLVTNEEHYKPEKHYNYYLLEYNITFTLISPHMPSKGSWRVEAAGAVTQDDAMITMITAFEI